MTKKVLITGASGGFGKLTVKSLLGAGHNVAATMRGAEGKNKAAAEELAAAGANVIELDVTSDASVDEGVARSIETLGGLDVVVNNAGVGVAGMQEFFTADDLAKVFNVNVFGLHRVTRAALPQLREQQEGLLVHISSILGRVCLPFFGPYNAAKWAVEALSDNYRVELSHFGIESVLVEPGGFATTFFNSLIQPSDESRKESYGEYQKAPDQMFSGLSESMAGNTEQDPQLVADAVLRLVETPAGERPARTVVDKMGMGALVEPANAQLEDIMKNLYGAFQMDQMLSVKQPEA